MGNLRSVHMAIQTFQKLSYCIIANRNNAGAEREVGLWEYCIMGRRRRYASLLYTKSNVAQSGHQSIRALAGVWCKYVIYAASAAAVRPLQLASEHLSTRQKSTICHFLRREQPACARVGDDCATKKTVPREGKERGRGRGKGGRTEDRDGAEELFVAAWLWIKLLRMQTIRWSSPCGAASVDVVVERTMARWPGALRRLGGDWGKLGSGGNPPPLPFLDRGDSSWHRDVLRKKDTARSRYWRHSALLTRSTSGLSASSSGALSR